MIRWGAAIALARLGRTDSAVIVALADATANPLEHADLPLVRFLDGDLRGYASQVLATLADALTSEAFDAVLDGLFRSEQIQAFSITAAALRLAFPQVTAPLPPFEELSDRQQRVVRVLADLGLETWRWVNFTAMPASWNLPRQRPELRAHAGLPSPA